MSTTRVTVSLPEEQVQQIRKNTDNISGFVAEAVANRLRWQLIRKDLEDYQSTHGAFTDEEMRIAKEDLTPYVPDTRISMAG